MPTRRLRAFIGRGLLILLATSQLADVAMSEAKCGHGGPDVALANGAADAASDPTPCQHPPTQTRCSAPACCAGCTARLPSVIAIRATLYAPARPNAPFAGRESDLPARALAGFHIRVAPNGEKTFYVRYRAGFDRNAPRPRLRLDRGEVASRLSVAGCPPSRPDRYGLTNHRLT